MAQGRVPQLKSFERQKRNSITLIHSNGEQKNQKYRMNLGFFMQRNNTKFRVSHPRGRRNETAGAVFSEKFPMSLSSCANQTTNQPLLTRCNFREDASNILYLGKEEYQVFDVTESFNVMSVNLIIKILSHLVVLTDTHM